MPYPGIKPGSETERKMESCVKEIMATGKNKSNAIAICHNSIMGSKKMDSGSLPNQITFNINLKDYWNTVNTGTTFDGSETITTGTYDTFIGEEMMDSTSSPQEDINDKTKGGDKKSMAKKDEKTVKKQDEEEVTEEVVTESEESTEAGTESVEDNAEETATEPEVTKDGEEEASEDAEAEPAKAEAAPAEVESDSAEVEQAEEVSTLLKSVIAKIDKLVEKQDEGDDADSATTEGAATEAAPEGGEEESPKEEASEGDADTSNDDGSSEGAEDGEVAKSLGKVADSMEKLTKSVDDVSKQVSEIDARLTKIEEQPVPSKVESPVVVSKGGSSEEASGEKAQRLEEIAKRLEELDKMKKDTLDKYQEAKGWEEAFTLMGERDYIKSTIR